MYVKKKRRNVSVTKVISNQAEIKQEIKQIKILLNNDSTKEKQSKKYPSTLFLSLKKQRAFQKGDTVQICNPNSTQENFGVIESFNKIGQPRVRTPGNNLITQASGNLILIEAVDTGSQNS